MRRRYAAPLLAGWLVFAPALLAPVAESEDPTLRAMLERSYAELFEQASNFNFGPVRVEALQTRLREAEKRCRKGFSKQAKAFGKQAGKAQDELSARRDRLSDAERRELHCRIRDLRSRQNQTEIFADHAVPVAYANLGAKLDLVAKWPAELRRIEAELRSEAHYHRRYGDVEDIGFREIAEGQEKDVKRGKRAVDELKQLGLMPKELDSEPIQSYVVELTRGVAARSDLRVPVKVAVLDSGEINAFALPGGFLYVHRGLLEAVEDESQLVGVLAHEIAHAAARHGHQLMKRATIASIIYQAAQIAAVIATGGVVGIGTYYALQYGFYGLGLVLSLDLLGVSREFELEADQLGVQYAWNAGYDPRGFIRFSDRMATTQGYVRGASWFRTHPPFYERMVATAREIRFLPEKERLAVQTTEFMAMKRELAQCKEVAVEDDPCRPSLLEPADLDCPPPELIEYDPTQPIEKLCEAAR